MIRTRIAPSPTGKDVHIGSVATALMNYAWAKKNNGKFIIRIEDTDQSRLVPGGEKKMLTTLQELGIIADESPLVGGPFAPYRQSERLDIYKKYAKELIDKGKAYYCTCTSERLTEMRAKQQAEKKVPRYDRFCLSQQETVKKQIEGGMKYVVRLLIPETEIVFTDLIRGEVRFQSSNLDDQVLLKSDGFPTYHLGVVVDDHLMEITHVMRGEEWLPSTPKHIILYDAFGWDKPFFGHVSLLRNPDKSKLSKRKNPVWASEYIEKGIFPEALLNYLALMGWSHPEGKDIFDLEEYIRVFDIKDVQTTAPVFDTTKLEWMNGEYIRQMPIGELKNKVINYIGEGYDEKVIEKTIPLVRERMKKLSDYLPLTEFLFKAPNVYEIPLEKYKETLDKVNAKLGLLSEFSTLKIGEAMVDVAKESGLKNSEFFQMLRVAITGKKISPPLNESMEILGKEECIKRIKAV
ncbi:MAG: glutamate--tRNA ligase [Candidatus Roizmanbacteria bacterium]|nr:glutamate--tRNA ligase [Candidatus Roizmanbacteria bacterium]